MMRGLLALLALFLVGIAPANAASSAKVKATIDHDEPPSAIAESVEALVEDLRKNDGKIVELDLSVASAAGDAPPDYSARTRNGKQAVKCEGGFGHQYGNDERAFSFKFASYNHLMLEIIHRTGLAYPFNHAYCAYDAARPDAPILTIKGYYVPRVIPVPQAFEMVLTPVNP